MDSKVVNEAPLILISAVFATLFTLALFLFNLRIVVTPDFIKARFREVDIYQPIASGFKDNWTKKFHLGTGNALERIVIKNIRPEWLQNEIERNIDELGNYLGGRTAELDLFLKLEPISQEVFDDLEITEREVIEEIKSSLPEKVEILGERGFLGEELGKQLYQLKITLEAVELSLKIIAFVLLLAILSFFFLCHPEEAWRWLGWSLLGSGLLLLVFTLILRFFVGERVFPFLIQEMKLNAQATQLATQLIGKFLQTYLELIQWQSLFVLGLGVLILLINSISRMKE